MATGGYGASRNFTGFGNNQEGGTPDLTGLSSGYGQGLAQVWNFTPQFQQQGQQNYDIMTKLWAEQQAKQQADIAKQNELFGTDLNVGAITEDVPFAQQIMARAKELNTQALQNPLMRSYVNKRLSPKASVYAEVTPEEEKAYRDYSTEMSKLQQAKLGFEQRKAESEAYRKAVAAKKEAYDIGVEQDIRAENLNDPFLRAQQRIRPYAEKQNITDWTQGKLLSILEKTADVSTQILNIAGTEFKGTDAERFAKINEITKSGEEKAKSLLENLWQQPEMQSTYDPKIKQLMAQSGISYEQAKKTIFENELLPLAKNLQINQIKSKLQDNPYALSAYNKALEFAYGQKTKQLEYTKGYSEIERPNGQNFGITKYQFPLGKIPDKLQTIPAEKGMFNFYGNKPFNANQSFSGKVLDASVVYFDKQHNIIPSKNVTIEKIKKGEIVPQGYYEYLVPDQQALTKAKEKYDVTDDSLIDIRPSTRGNGVDIYQIVGEGEDAKSKLIGWADTEVISVPQTSETMETFRKDWYAPSTPEFTNFKRDYYGLGTERAPIAPQLNQQQNQPVQPNPAPVEKQTKLKLIYTQ